MEHLKIDLRKAQQEQREMIKSNSKVLDRNYDREAYNKMISNMGIKQLKSDELDGTIKGVYKTNLLEVDKNIDKQKELRTEFNKRFEDGTYKNIIDDDKQKKHIKGAKQYETAIKKEGPKSILDVDPDTLIKYIGKGVLKKRKDGQLIETIIMTRPVGLYVSYKLERPIKTNVFEVRFSKDGYHFIPVHPAKGKG